ncbi:uncharacterized protein [Lepeophtheirus salmonis]|uniref:uncharacterized protein n=1 Tax=Lepeophtheirus salmonis TaxID=72036 RepID=UPI001AE761EF|nr:uncharacterized protein LOC121113617 [Lepeophtheirus salmonis]
MQKKGQYFWVNGNPFYSFPFWRSGNVEQGHDCVVASKTRDKMQGDCEEKTSFLCEMIPAYCPIGFFYFPAEDTCLFYSATNRLSFIDARQRCRSMSPRKGSHPVVVNGKSLNNLIFDMSKNEDFYIGLSTGTLTTLVWENGDDYEASKSGMFMSPSAHVNTSTTKKCYGNDKKYPYQWTHMDCDLKLRYFCQVEPNYPQLPPTPPKNIFESIGEDGVYENDEVTPQAPLATIPEMIPGNTFAPYIRPPSLTSTNITT